MGPTPSASNPIALEEVIYLVRQLDHFVLVKTEAFACTYRESSSVLEFAE